MSKVLYLIFLLFTSAIGMHAQTLDAQIKAVTQGKKASVSVSALGIERPFQFQLRSNTPRPMLSVFKFPIALKMFSLIDQGHYSLETPVYVRSKDLLPNTWSPLRNEYPNGNVNLPLKTLIEYTVAQSDNNACDILIRLIGGTNKIEKFIHDQGIKEFKMHFNEAQMHENWENQYQNLATTDALASLLRKFYLGEILSKVSTENLYRIMLETKTGSNKIKAHLPAGSTAHKTGSSGRNQSGLKAAENDIAVITMPDRTHLAVAVLVSNSMESDSTNTRMIADISKLIYDHYNLKSQYK